MRDLHLIVKAKLFRNELFITYQNRSHPNHISFSKELSFFSIWFK